MPLHNVRRKTNAPPKQVMEIQQASEPVAIEPVTMDPVLEKRILFEMMAIDLKERDDQLDELKFLNDEMRRGYEDQIRILKELGEKTASNPDVDQIKKMIESKEKQLISVLENKSLSGDADVRPDNVYVEKATKALREDVDADIPALVKTKKKKGQRPVSALKKPNAVQKIWK